MPRTHSSIRSNIDAMYQRERMLNAIKEDTLLYDSDAAPPPGEVMAAKPMEILGVQQFKWPGGDLSDQQGSPSKKYREKPSGKLSGRHVSAGRPMLLSWAAGIAAARAISSGVDLRKIDIKKLQADLKKQGVILPG